MVTNNTKTELPPIPAKRYFTIGEVSELCAVKPHVLRYWEQEFSQLKPIKRRGNRRYYQHHEVLLVRQIRGLLYEQGFTISGARLRLGEYEAQAVRKSDMDTLRVVPVDAASLPQAQTVLVPPAPVVAPVSTVVPVASVATVALVPAPVVAPAAPAVSAPQADFTAIRAELVSILEFLRLGV